jgi:hypothetical protein
MLQEVYRSLEFLPSALAGEQGGRPFVALVRSRDELRRWLGEPPGGLQWIQIEELLGDPDAWAQAASGASQVPFDVVLSDPASEFSDLYRLVDVCTMRDVRVTMPAAPGCLKAIKLAASLRLPVRVIPGQPSPEVLAELVEALEFYLHEPMVEMPVEFFHSLLAAKCGADAGSLWMILEEDPAAFLHYDAEGRPQLPRSSGFRPIEISPEAFVEHHLKSLTMFGGSLGTSMDYPNVHRKLYKGGAEAYTELWTRRLHEARAAGIEVGVIAVLHQPSLDARAGALLPQASRHGANRYCSMCFLPDWFRLSAGFHLFRKQALSTAHGRPSGRRCRLRLKRP